MNGFVFCLVAALVVIPMVVYEPQAYLAVVARFWPWIAFASLAARGETAAMGVAPRHDAQQGRRRG